MSDVHLLYSYRRCPYAMRARMALVSAKIECAVHEIDFKNKPAHMLKISPKGTVPVLQTIQGDVIEESLEIMVWALQYSDPKGFLVKNNSYIQENDGPFKAALDRYKYPNRFPDEDCTGAREDGLEFLQKLNAILATQKQLMSNEITMVDIAIFPFIRQFANVDRAWFEEQNLGFLKNWLQGHLDSDLFRHIFKKQSESPYLLL